MLRYLGAAAALLLALSATALAAAKYENFRSEVRAVDPPVAGLELEVLGGDEAIELRNESGRLVVVEGYDNEPYLRFKPGGTVEQNLRSPATYLNADRSGKRPVPESARPGATPSWKAVSDEGKFRWLDHRTHITTDSVPRRLREAKQRKKIFDWRIPIQVAGEDVAVKGTLYWDPDASGSSSDGFPTALVVAGGVALALLGGAALVIARRRRRPRAGGSEAEPSGEAW